MINNYLFDKDSSKTRTNEIAGS